jgi:hypothetical protein
MITPLVGNRHVWEKQQSKNWNRPRFTRSRRPLLLALCTVAFFLCWYHSTLTPSGHTFHQHIPNPNELDKRSIPGQDKIVIPKQPLPFLVASQEQLPNDNARLHKHEEYAQEEDEDHVHTHDIQVEEHQHLEHTDSDGNSLADTQDSDADKDEEEDNTPKQETSKDSERNEGSHVISPDLDSDIQKEAVISLNDQPVKENLETEPDEHLSLEEKASSLPEIVYRPFEDTVKDFVLEEWMDDWVAHASFNPAKWEKLQEPKIDFVYLCT